MTSLIDLFNEHKTKIKVANALGISRPTLDKTIRIDPNFDYKEWQKGKYIKSKQQKAKKEKVLLKKTKIVKSSLLILREKLDKIHKEFPNDPEVNNLLFYIFAVGDDTRKNGKFYQIVKSAFDYYFKDI